MCNTNHNIAIPNLVAKRCSIDHAVEFGVESLKLAVDRARGWMCLLGYELKCQVSKPKLRTDIFVRWF